MPPLALPPDADDRYREVLQEATRMFGPVEGAKYMSTRNFALGGLTPQELTLTQEGTRQVHNELSAHGSGGPL